jgi:hypothetical protein
MGNVNLIQKILRVGKERGKSILKEYLSQCFSPKAFGESQ